MVLPKMSSDILRQNNARNSINGSRYNVLRSESPARTPTDTRGRSNSFKRKNDDRESGGRGFSQNAAAKSATKLISEEAIAKMESSLTTVKTVKEKIVQNANKIDMGNDFKELFNGIFEILDTLTLNQETMLSSIKKQPKPEQRYGHDSRNNRSGRTGRSLLQ